MTHIDKLQKEKAEQLTHIEKLQKEKAETEVKIVKLKGDITNKDKYIKELINSLSWKTTAPFRRLSDLIRGKGSKV